MLPSMMLHVRQAVRTGEERKGLSEMQRRAGYVIALRQMADVFHY